MPSRKTQHLSPNLSMSRSSYELKFSLSDQNVNFGYKIVNKNWTCRINNCRGESWLVGLFEVYMFMTHKYCQPKDYVNKLEEKVKINL